MFYTAYIYTYLFRFKFILLEIYNIQLPNLL